MSPFWSGVMIGAVGTLLVEGVALWLAWFVCGDEDEEDNERDPRD